jgi:hypothetical protein
MTKADIRLTRNGEKLASIGVQMERHSVILRYRNRSYGEDWADIEQCVSRTRRASPSRVSGCPKANVEEKPQPPVPQGLIWIKARNACLVGMLGHC